MLCSNKKTFIVLQVLPVVQRPGKSGQIHLYTHARLTALFLGLPE